MSPIVLSLVPLGLTDWWSAWWLVPLILLASPYLVGPLMIRLTQKIGANFKVERFDPDESPAPDRADEFFGETAAQLQKCGFEVVDHQYVSDLINGMLNVHCVMVNPASNDVALAAIILATINGITARERHIEFGTELIDGSTIETTNSKEDGALAAFPWRRLVQLDTEQDAAALYDLHQRAVEKWAAAPMRSFRNVEDWADVIRDGMMREFNGYVEAGYYFLDATGEHYRPTWKGAFLMAWKLLWPIGTLRRLARRRRAQALRSEAPSFAT